MLIKQPKVLKFSFRALQDKVGRQAMRLLTVFTLLIVIFIAAGLVYKSIPIFGTNSISDVLFSSKWAPLGGHFGMLVFIMSTIWVTTVAMVVCIPLSLLCAIYLSEYAPKRIVRLVNPVIDLLAGIPSVIYGIWGIIFLVPLIRNYIAPAFGVSSSGYSILAGGIVLAIMSFPVIIHVMLEVLATIPQELRNASLSLGATQWQTIKKVVLRRARPGIISAIVLGVSRAFGETLAVLMVVGNVVKLPHSVFDAAYPLPALIANNYGEMMSIPLYDSALMLASLVLFVTVLIFNIISNTILIRIEKQLS